MSNSKNTKSLEEAIEPENFFSELFKTMVLALLIAFVLRTFLFQSFRIPTGSMEPNLQVGDYIITTKYSLGYGKYAADPIPFPVKSGRLFEREPKHGDIIVFKPVGETKYFIKRLIGLPGDEIQMKSGFLYVNGRKLATEKMADESMVDRGGNMVVSRIYKEYFANETASHIIKQFKQGNIGDDTNVFPVPTGHYFFMGDNRDNSLDSRFSIPQGGVGFVPAANLVGRAEFVLLSVEKDFELFKPWTWGNIRSDRFFKGL